MTFVYWGMRAKAIRSTGLACVTLMLASCASDPYYSNSGYSGGGYPNNGGIDATKTAALVAAGIAGLSLYHYGKEKNKRKKAERSRDYHRYGSNYGHHNRSYDRYDSRSSYGHGRDYRRRGW